MRMRNSIRYAAILLSFTFLALQPFRAIAQDLVFTDSFEVNATLIGRLLDTNAFVTDGSIVPIEGATIRLLDVPSVAVSNAEGYFYLRSLPLGEQILDIDTELALPAPNGDNYAGFRERIELTLGINNITRPFYLPRIDATSLTTINPAQDTVVTNPGLGISMTVLAGTALDEEGNLFAGELSISEVPGALAPAALPAFLQPGLLITIQPVGVTFSTPAPITFSNGIDNLRPGSETDLWSLDPEAGIFVVVGTGQVSGDGSTIDTISGGIIAADWHMPLPPPPKRKRRKDDPPDCDGCCPSCDAGVGSEVDLFNGQLTERFNLPPVFSQNRIWAPEFVYRTRRAYPQYFLPVDMEIEGRASIPEVIFYQNIVDEQPIDTPVYIDTSTMVDGADEPFRVSAPLDATGLASGLYDVNTQVTSSYIQSNIAQDNVARLSVINETNSPFGAGWSLSGLDYIIPDAVGTIRENLLLVEGDGGSIQFEENLSGINPNGLITVLIRQNTSCCWSQETTAIRDMLTDMGFASQLIVGNEFTQEVIDESRMIIWVDFSFVASAADPINREIGRLLLEAEAQGMPLFFLGTEPANFTNINGNEDFVADWLSLVKLQLASSSSGGAGLVTVAETSHPIFDGPAGSLTEFTISEDADVTRGAGSGEQVLASSATADIVVVNESPAGGRTVTFNATFVVFQGNDNEPDVEIVTRNAVTWLLNSPSVATGFFGENQFVAVDGDFSGIIRDEVSGDFTRILKDGSQQFFDAGGRQTRRMDRNGNEWLYAYNGNGLLQTITDPVNRVTTFAYDGNNKLQSVTDAASRVTQFTVDGNGDLTEVEFPDTSTRSFTYDARHLIASQTDRESNTTTYQFDDWGFFTQSTQPDTSVRQSTAAQSVGLVDTSGGMGSEANPAPVTRPDDAISGFIDPLSRMTDAATGPFGEPLSVTGSDGLLTDYQRDTNGNPLTTSLPNGLILDATYDITGNRLSQTNSAFGGTWSFSYESEFNQVESATDPAGNTYQLTYDNNGDLLSFTSEENRSIAFTWNADGFPQTFTGANGTVSTYSYDSMGMLEQIDEGTGPEQRTTSTTRNATGDLDTVTDAESRSFTYGYDAFGRPTTLTLPDTEVISIGWNSEDKLVEVTPPDQPLHELTYTPFGAIASYQPPDIGGLVDTSFSYNLGQQLQQVDRADGRSVIISYDPAGRLATRQIARGTSTVTYDPVTGLIASVAAPGPETLAHSYTGPWLSGQSWSGTVDGDVNFTFDTLGRIASESIDGANSVSYVYDGDSLPTQAGALTISREATTGLPADTTLSMVTDDYTFNDFGELVGYEASFDGTPVYAYTLTRDKLGRITDESETVSAVTQVYEYTIDNRGRLERVDIDSALAAEYSYDANGNRLERDDGVNTETGVYDAQDRMTSYNGVTYSYRQSGELLTRTDGANVTTYQYDELGNLITVDLPSGDEIEYVIDANERRIGRMINDTLTHGWLYRDDTNPVAEFDGNGNLISRFVYGIRPNVPDYMIRDGNTYRIISDQNGSVRLVIDTTTGMIAQRLDYDAFGRVLMDTNPGFQPFGFAGGMYDPLTGLVRFGARDYDPFAGRWTAKDPILFAGGDTNLYAYVFNNPLDRIDPDGLTPEQTNGQRFGGAPADLSPNPNDPVARIVRIKGDGRVFVTRANGDIEQGYIDMKIYQGDQLRTNNVTFAAIEFYTGGEIGLNKNTRICVDSEDTVELLTPEKGLIESILDTLSRPREKPVEIRRSSGVMGIRG